MTLLQLKPLNLVYPKSIIFVWHDQSIEMNPSIIFSYFEFFMGMMNFDKNDPLIYNANFIDKKEIIDWMNGNNKLSTNIDNLLDYFLFNYERYYVYIIRPQLNSLSLTKQEFIEYINNGGIFYLNNKLVSNNKYDFENNFIDYLEIKKDYDNRINAIESNYDKNLKISKSNNIRYNVLSIILEESDRRIIIGFDGMKMIVTKTSNLYAFNYVEMLPTTYSRIFFELPNCFSFDGANPIKIKQINRLLTLTIPTIEEFIKYYKTVPDKINESLKKLFDFLDDNLIRRMSPFFYNNMDEIQEIVQ